MKKIMKNTLIFISYLIYEYVFIIILDSFGIKYGSFSVDKKLLCIFVFNLIFIVSLLLLYKKEIIKDFKDFKINHRSYLFNYILIYIIGVLLMGVSNIVLQLITNLKTSGNESTVRALIKLAPTFMFFSSIIYAPFVEEIIFRKAIRNIFKNKYLFIFISGFIFGILHISNYKDINEILMGIPYIIMGLDFAYIYYKTNNIFTTMTFHLCHNLILLIVQLL